MSLFHARVLACPIAVHAAVLSMALSLLTTAIHAADDIVIADFEGDTYGAWSTTGDAFGPGPASGTLPNQQTVHGYLGKHLVNSYNHGDGATGTLTSPAFVITRPYLTYLIGGGKDEEKLSLALEIDGHPVRRATGTHDQPGGSEDLEAGWWDVSDVIGKSAIIRITDQAIGGWGHLLVDQLVMTERKPATVIANATRSITAEKRYLYVPIKNGAAKRLVTTFVDGHPIERNDIELADGPPDWWAFIDIGSYAGKTVTLTVNKLLDSSTALSSIIQNDVIPGADTVYREPLRGQFHFSSRVGWLNDPNGLVYFQGEYHLFYQHNPYGVSWGNMHWGHAVSPDLVHWQDLGDVLAPDDEGAMFSGSAVVDWRNTSGLGTAEHPPIVLIYTAAGNPTVQCLASSTDGRTFTKYARNPVIAQISGGNRDPKVMWHEPTKRWVMTLYVGLPAGKHSVHILTSPNLREWTVASIVEGGSDGDHFLYECPDLFALPVDGQSTRASWVLTAASDEYATGTFNGTSYSAQQSRLRGDQGRGFYAAQSYSDIPAADGRRIQIGWFQAPTPGMPFNQSMTIPQVLTLTTTPDGMRLTRMPIAELTSLRTTSHRFGSVVLAPDSPNPLAMITSELVEVRADLVPGTSTTTTFTLRGANLTYDAATQDLLVNGLRAHAPLRQGHLTLIVYIDRMALEVFASDGLVYVPMPFLPKADDRSLSLRCHGGTLTIADLQVHDLGTAWR